MNFLNFVHNLPSWFDSKQDTRDKTQNIAAIIQNVFILECVLQDALRNLRCVVTESEVRMRNPASKKAGHLLAKMADPSGKKFVSLRDEEYGVYVLVLI